MRLCLQAAYYTCILQLLTSHRFPADDLDEIASAIEATPHRDAGAAESPSPVAFVIGDSHVLPMAFRVMRNGGRLRVLVPLLVTGDNLAAIRLPCCTRSERATCRSEHYG